uniref:Uncharacterized protein n=1 Tax=Tanacetum cinerariifolium TaxID=118510 RepID=A0A6L2MDP2_TANCI|nr:hypothetical protein [Tanacetum cinerariifolium]
MDKCEGEEDIFLILNNFNLKMSKIADPVGKSGDHIEKMASSNVLRSCSDEIFRAKSNKKVLKIQELRNKNVVEGAAVAIPFEVVEEVKSRFYNTLYGFFIDNGHTLATIDVEYEWNPPRYATYENEGDGFRDESLKQDEFLNVSNSEVDEEFQVDHNGNVSSNRTGASTPANEGLAAALAILITGASQSRQHDMSEPERQSLTG